MRTLSAITTVLVISAVGSAAAAQGNRGPRTSNEEGSTEAGGTERVEVRAPRRAFELGLSGGYTQPFGEIRDDLAIRGVIIAGGAVGLALGYRFDPHWSLEGTAQYQEMVAGATAASGSAVRGLTTGLQGTYHFRPYRVIDPYVALGTGYRMMWIVPTGGPNDLIHGFQLAKALVGVDLRMTPGFALGPVIGADVNVFVWNDPGGPAGTRNLNALRPSTFLFAGLGGHFDVGGYRVPQERAARGFATVSATTTTTVSAPPARPAERPFTLTAISVERRILQTCNIEGPKAYFDFDEANLTVSDEAALDQVAKCFASGPLKGKQMKIVGHTDPRGSDEYNQKLGKSRAQSVSSYLSDKGVPTPEMSTESRGEQDATGSDEIGWAYDRRVDIRVGD